MLLLTGCSFTKEYWYYRNPIMKPKPYAQQEQELDCCLASAPTLAQNSRVKMSERSAFFDCMMERGYFVYRAREFSFTWDKPSLIRRD